MAAEAVATPPPTAPAPAAKPGPTFDARVALAKTLGKPRTDATPPPAETTENIDAPPAEETADASESAEAEAETETAGGETPAETPDADAAVASGDPDRMAAAADAFAKGDLDALAKALGKDGSKLPGPVKSAFRAHSRRMKQIDASQK